MRQRLPGLAAEKLPKLGVEAMWVYHPLVSRRLARITKLAGVELIAWTVDDLPRMRKLIAAGVNGLCSNDPRLFAQLPAAHPTLTTTGVRCDASAAARSDGAGRGRRRGVAAAALA